MSELPVVQCVTCHAEMHGRFCHVCGERRADERDLSLRGILHRTLDAVTDVDARFYRTYRALITRPGSLAAAYAQGRTVGWLSPLALLLLTTLIFYVYHTLTGRATFFTLPLDLQLQDPIYGALASDIIADRFPALRGIRFGAFRTRFDLLNEEYAKALVIVMAPVVAAVLAILRLPAREPVGLHFAFALHLLAFLLLVLMVTPAVLWVIAGPLPPKARFWLLSDGVLLAVAGCALTLHAFAALRRAYGARVIVALPLAVVLTFALFAAAHVYRFALFLIVHRIA